MLKVPEANIEIKASDRGCSVIMQGPKEALLAILSNIFEGFIKKGIFDKEDLITAIDLATMDEEELKAIDENIEDFLDHIFKSSVFTKEPKKETSKQAYMFMKNIMDHLKNDKKE